jgi:hypothetical protein
LSNPETVGITGFEALFAHLPTFFLYLIVIKRLSILKEFTNKSGQVGKVHFYDIFGTILEVSSGLQNKHGLL